MWTPSEPLLLKKSKKNPKIKTKRNQMKTTITMSYFTYTDISIVIIIQDIYMEWGTLF